MFLTLAAFAKKAKSKHILVYAQSLVSGHGKNRIRERLGDKMEFMAYDPHVDSEVMYREVKKIRNIYNLKEKKPLAP